MVVCNPLKLGIPVIGERGKTHFTLLVYPVKGLKRQHVSLDRENGLLNKHVWIARYTRGTKGPMSHSLKRASGAGEVPRRT